MLQGERSSCEFLHYSGKLPAWGGGGWGGAQAKKKGSTNSHIHIASSINIINMYW